MRSALAWTVCFFVAIAAPPVLGQAARPEGTAFATLCMVQWSIGPIWAGSRLGCPPVLQPLQAPNRPCRTRYSTSDTREEARLRYDTAGRLREVEHVGRVGSRTSHVYDAEGRVTAHTRHTVGPSETTSFAYAQGAISEDDSSSDYRHRWQLEGERLISEEYAQGARDAPPFSVSRWIYEGAVFIGVDTIVCRTPPSDPSARCEPSGPPQRSSVRRDRTGRITGWTNGDDTDSFTYDARGRLTRTRSIRASTRFQSELRVDYVCPEG